MRPEIQIRNGLIVDGSGCRGKKGCLDIAGGRIVGIHGPERQAGCVIDAEGCIVCPGFIDAHTHADLFADDPAQMEACLMQGVTTCVVGNCGFSAFPVTGRGALEYLNYGAGVLGSRDGFTGTKDFLEYREFMQRNRIPVNIASQVGHGILCADMAGDGTEPPDGFQIREMCGLLDGLLRQGAAGLSLGLAYAPGAWARRKELCALARVVAEHNKVLSVHLRNEGDQLHESMDEMLDIAREAGVHLHISHHKVMGRANHGQSDRSLKRIEEANKDGLQVTLDAYPYAAACSTAMVLLPPWVLANGFEEALVSLRDPEIVRRIEADLATGLPGWENLSASCGWDALVVSSTASNRSDIVGKSIELLGKERGISSPEALIHVIMEEKGCVSVVLRGMARYDVDQIITYPGTVIGSDGLFSQGGAHPRRYGAFARVLCDFVRRRRLMGLETAVHKMTDKTARIFGLSGRGLLKNGYWADIAVFSMDEFIDRADYEHPDRAAGGMRTVLVNGVPVLDGGLVTGHAPGRLLPV